MKIRIILALASCILFISLLGILRPGQPGYSGLPEELFWYRKISEKGPYDIVVAGDSRIFRGVSPAQMNRVLGELKILNFSFSGCAYDDRYLDAIEARLDKKSKYKTIILGISTYSLTPVAARNNDFIQWSQIPDSYAFMLSRAPEITTFFKPYTADEAILLFFKKMPENTYYNRFNDDGWVGSFVMNPDKNVALVQYDEILRRNKVSPKLIVALEKRIRKWTSEGILVIAFRSPTSYEMRLLEEAHSKYTDNDFAKIVAMPGGYWLAENYIHFDSYDGSHISAQEALRFSTSIALQTQKLYRDRGL